MGTMSGQAPQGPQPLPGIHHIIAVGSGKGGVGKTTVAVNLAIALSRLGTNRVGLLDADVYGPNVPLMMGSRDQPRVLEGNQIGPLEAHGVKLISVGSISPGDKPMVMAWPDAAPDHPANSCSRVQWGELDYLIIDLPPPGTGDVVISLVQTVPLTGAVIVSTPSDVALQDGRKAIEMFRQVNVGCAGDRRKHELFHMSTLPPGDRYFFQRRGGTNRTELPDCISRFCRARSGDSLWRRSRVTSFAGRRAVGTGSAVFQDCAGQLAERAKEHASKETNILEIR